MLLLLQALESLAIYLAIFLVLVLVGLMAVNAYKIVRVLVRRQWLKEYRRQYRALMQEGRGEDHAEP